MPTTKTHPRVIHLGLGAFHRAHQAWYTQNADRIAHDHTGIWAFTGRRPDAAELLADQGYRYTLMQRGASGDELSLIDSITAASAGSDLHAWHDAWRAPSVGVVTLTITEAAYRRQNDDLDQLRAGQPESALTRLVSGLSERYRADLAPVAVVPCDNLAGNGSVLAAALTGLAEEWDAGLGRWIREHVSFPHTMVDRITPGTTDADRATATDWKRRHGDTTEDRMPVVCEPFSEWVIAGSFPAGRPAWDQAGAQFVDDAEPYERRKLWLLNAGHSLLAYVGLARGWRTIDEAMTDAYCTELLEDLWAAAAAVLPFPQDTIQQACEDLRGRFTNPRIAHQLGRIATDGTQKMSQRTAAIHRARRANGLGISAGIAASFAGWLSQVRSGPVHDQGIGDLQERLQRTGSEQEQIRRMLDHLDPELTDADLVSAIGEQLKKLQDGGRS